MYALGIILCRAGSRGLPKKAVRPLCGQPVITYTFEHARASTLLDDVVLSTDCRDAATLAEEHGIEVIDRPADLATDDARVDDAARHCTEVYQAQHCVDAKIIVLLYANVPVRPPGLIDDAIHQLIETGADSVRSVAPVGKKHPLWLHRLEGDRMTPYHLNSVYRRQNLEPLYYHDGAVIALRRRALFTPASQADDPQAFFGRDRRAIVQGPYDAVDIDDADDLHLAEALLMQQRTPAPPPAQRVHATVASW